LELLILIKLIPFILPVILFIVSCCFIYVKAGYRAIEAIIPIYSLYILLKICRISTSWLYGIVAIFVIGFLSNFIKIDIIVVFIEIIYLIVLYAIINISLAREFDQKIAFACGLIFLPMIFYPILAFGESKYIENKKISRVFSLNNNDDDYIPHSSFFKDE